MVKARFWRLLVRLLIRAVQIPRVLIYSLLSNSQFHGRPSCHQPVQAVGTGIIKFGTEVGTGCFPSPLFSSTYAYIEARQPTATVSISNGTWINNNFPAIAEHTSINIWENCRIGTSVEIIDSDFHGVKVSGRGLSKPEWEKTVSVGDYVFIGSNVKILKGVTIGNGVVISNGSIVTKDFPSDVVIGGNPATVLNVIRQ